MTDKVLQTKTFEIACKSCESKLEYEYADIKQGQSTDYTGDTDYYRYISCPVCNNKVVVKQ